MTTSFRDKTSAALACAALACGVLSWVLTRKLFMGLDIAAIVLGIISLRLASKDVKLIRRIAWLGLAIGAAKVILIIFGTIALFVAFMINPVAH
ncbi:MAG: hypothetical protein HY801_06070 [Candidatus Lindowbacteria bacterium]|nr:hypothetical protein [Candidatus Lindowbacteria bacterium]